jgi:hypothetical protein
MPVNSLSNEDKTFCLPLEIYALNILLYLSAAFLPQSASVSLMLEFFSPSL